MYILLDEFTKKPVTFLEVEPNDKTKHYLSVPQEVLELEKDIQGEVLKLSENLTSFSVENILSMKYEYLLQEYSDQGYNQITCEDTLSEDSSKFTKIYNTGLNTSWLKNYLNPSSEVIIKVVLPISTTDICILTNCCKDGEESFLDFQYTLKTKPADTEEGIGLWGENDWIDISPFANETLSKSAKTMYIRIKNPHQDVVKIDWLAVLQK